MSRLFFEFRRVEDNSAVACDELDRAVCDEFGLECGNLNGSGEEDYGHFILNEDLYGQGYISWRGLVSTILYYGDVRSGDVSMREVLDMYVFDVWEVAIAWPDESVVLVSKLLKFLQEKRLYIHAEWW